MTRKRVTPYPAQVAQYIKSLKSGAAPFSALTLYEILEHPKRGSESSHMGDINKTLHRAWAAGDLISFVDSSRTVLREKAFGRPGSAAAEHPQVFALPRTPSLEDDYEPTTYEMFCDHEPATPKAPEVPLAEPATQTDDSPRRKNAPKRKQATSKKPPVALPFASDEEAQARYESWTTGGDTPSWLPQDLMREWSARPIVLAEYRAILSGNNADLKRQVIPTGLKRKGSVDAESDIAERLARLCVDDAFFWELTIAFVMADVGNQGLLIDSSEWRRFFSDDWISLSADHSCEVVLLSGMRLGMDEEALELLALEAVEELHQRRESSQSVALEQDVDRLSTSLQERKQQLHDAREENRELKKRTAELQRLLTAETAAVQALRSRLDGQDASDGDAQRALDEALTLMQEREQAWARERADLDVRIEELEATCAQQDAQLSESGGSDAEWEDRALILERQLARERAEHERLDEQLQESYRSLIELKDRAERLQQNAGALPAPVNADSLLDVLDAAVGAASKEAAEHLLEGMATFEDELVLRLASRIVEFKRELAADTAIATAAASEAPTASSPTPDAPSEAPEALTGSEPVAAVDAEEATTATEVSPREGTSIDEAEPPDESLTTARDELRSRRLLRSGTWTVRPIGGAGEIGASAVLVTSPDQRARILLDCGQRIPNAYTRDSNRSFFHYGVPGIDKLDAVLITHAHLDHIGSLPVIYRSPQVELGRTHILMSPPTLRLASLMLSDSAKLQNARSNDMADLAESDLDVDHSSMKPAYDADDVQRVLDAVTPAPAYEEIILPECGVAVTFLPVAHVLGSCAIRLRHLDSGRTLLYTGDLGPLSEQLLSLPDFGGLDLIEDADVVLMESTYGDLIEEASAPAGRGLPAEGGGRRARSVTKLLRLMRKTLEHDGFVLLPSFALGRSQELARLLGVHWGSEIPQAPLYLAGMGEQILDVYSDYEHQRAKGGTQWVNPGLFPRTERLASRVRTAASFADVIDEVLSGPPGYILATPAAMGGGWSQWFAERLVKDPRHAVAFTGYVPNGDRPYSLSRLKTGSQLRLMNGSRTPIECAWEKFSLSSHAQRDDLLFFADQMVAKNGDCRFGVMHGAPAGQAGLTKAIVAKHGAQRAVALENNREWVPAR